MELAYNEQGATGNTLLFNGNISAMKWSNSLGLGDVKENAYNYSYDAMNRIKSADFRQNKSGWSLPEYVDDNDNVHTAPAYTETGYQYDLNGNMLNLVRKTAKGEDMDSLTYYYGTAGTQSNKLLSVTDGGNTSTGFIDGNRTGDDYTYDANGSIVTTAATPEYQYFLKDPPGQRADDVIENKTLNRYNLNYPENPGSGIGIHGKISTSKASAWKGIFVSEKEIVNFRDVEIRRYGSDYDLIHRVK